MDTSGTDSKLEVASSHQYVNLHPQQEATEIASLCMNCHEQGVSRIMLASIPHFKEIIVMAFECPHCNFRNNEVQSAHTIAEKGVSYRLNIANQNDLNRQIVKTDTASIRIVELEFEIPPAIGELNTVEGFILKAREDLSFDQPERQHRNPDMYDKMQKFISELDDCLEGRRLPLTLILDDPAGNSYIEDLYVPKTDPRLKIERYERSLDQDKKLGLLPDDYQADDLDHEPEISISDKINIFPSHCSVCHATCEARMQIIDIPYFKETILMAMACDHCGYRSSEVKAGGAISEKGKKITLKVKHIDDLSRDILKSETCTLYIPEIELELTAGTLGGRFTTIEGLLEEIKEELFNKLSFSKGDSQVPNGRITDFLNKLRQLTTQEFEFMLILDDPLANSYIQNPYAPEADPDLTIEVYDRTFQQNEELGLNDIKTENYHASEESPAPSPKNETASCGFIPRILPEN